MCVTGLGALLCAATFGDSLTGRTTKALPLYAPNEEIVFEVRLEGFAGRDPAQLFLDWRRTGDDGKTETGRVALSLPFAYRTTLDRPGFVRLEGRLLDGTGKAVQTEVDGRRRPVICDLGAGVDILKIRPAVPAPADFDALWARHKANLASVAWQDEVALKEIASPTAGMKLFVFSVPCYGGKPTTGHLAVPSDTTRKYPATAKFFGYNESWTYRRAILPPEKLEENRITLYVSAHGFEMGHDEAYYQAAREKVKSNGYGHGFDPVQNADPEKTYYAGMTYRLMRALAFLKARPEWNGKDLRVTGGSQGGLQSIWAAALVPGVTEANISIPWNCDMGGTEIGRNRGTWFVQWVPGLGYYDACSMAPRIPQTCTVRVSMAGLGDYICPPTGVMAFYNSLACPKSIRFVQNAQHVNWLQGEPVQKFEIFGPSEIRLRGDGVAPREQGKAPPRPKHPKLAPEQRAAAIRPAAAGELRLTPTFTSVGLVWGSSVEVADLHAEWRAVGTEAWSRSERAAPWFDDVKNHRVSIWGLAENTDYEVRLVAGGETRAAGRVKTWASVVPIARTVDVSAATAFPIVVSEKGTPDGWVRVTAKGGRIAAPVTASSAILVTNAAYVVFDDLVITGGDQAGLLVVDSSRVRVRACDIFGWGSDGYVPRYDQRGALFKSWNAAKQRYSGGNHSGGIDLAAGATGVVVERCFIHAPRSRAHSWRYSHPYGPMAIRLRDSGGNHVIRWNDLVGSDRHRFDDAIGGGNDFYELGTFNRESDIYGNFVCFANDDCLEIDGGQQNVRVFGNRFEAGYMGVSVQGAIVSPSYVFDNLFSGCGEEFDGVASSIKTSGIDLFDYRPYVAIFDNVFWGRGRAVPLANQTARLNVWRNRCYGPEQRIFGLDARSPYTTLGANETNLVSAVAPSGDWPRRPIPYVTDISRLDGIRVAAGAAAPIERTVTLTCGGTDYAQPFKVVANGDADYLSVTPAAGIISSGRTLAFAVRLDPAKMTGRRHFRTVFLIRTADGFSRAVTVYAETDFVQPFACEKPGEVAVYAPVDPAAPYRTYGFDVPQDGRYYFMVRTRGQVNVLAAVDDEKPDVFKREVGPLSAWHILAPGGTYMSWACYYDLKKGAHTLTFAPAKKGGAFTLEGLVLTDHPGSFEPDAAKFGSVAGRFSCTPSGSSPVAAKGGVEK